MEIIILFLVILIIPFIVLNLVNGRFDKSVYKFQQYGIDFKVVKRYSFYEVIECDNILLYKRVGLVDLPHYKQYGTKDIQQGAHALVAEHYPFEREEWEEIERQTAEVVAEYQKLDEKMAEDLKNGIQPDWKD